MTGGKVLVGLALAISVGVLTVAAAVLYLEQRSSATVKTVSGSPAPPPIPTRKVVVLTTPLAANSLIEASHLKLADVPLHALPPGHVLDPAELVGRRVATNLSADKPVTVGDLVPREIDSELAKMLPDGSRAVSLTVSVVGGVSGFVLPGNRVDIILSGQSPDGQAFSRMLLQDVKVVAIAQERFVENRAIPRPATTVTLEVTPSQAEILEMGRAVGTLSFALRAQSDKSTVTTLGARQEELYGSKPRVEIIRGTTRSIE